MIFIMAFLLDKFLHFYYSKGMLSGIRIYCSDIVWRNILCDLNASITDSTQLADINFDDLNIELPISLLDLKTLIVDILDDSNLINEIFGKRVNMPQLQKRIVINLYKNGAVSVKDLKNMLGYLPNMATHAIDTAIYQLRKKYGHDFIINKNGKYTLGRL